MRRIAILAVAAFMLSIAATAYAANQYDVGAKFSPSKAGTKSKPRPVAVSLNFDVKTTDGEGARPSALSAVKISFAGTKINTVGPKCTASQINSGGTPSDEDCPSGAVLATGFANNLAGPIGNRMGPNVKCYLALTLYNSGSNKLALFVKGTPQSNADDPKHCPLPVQQAIPVTVKNSSKGATISLSIPARLKEPGPGVRNALREMNLKGRNKKAKRNGKTVGVFETFAACKGGKRAVTYEFTNEDGPKFKETAQASC